MLAIFTASLPSAVMSAQLTAGENQAQAILSNTLLQTGFDKVEMGTSSAINSAVRGGSECWLMDKLAGDSKAYINFKLSKEFKPAESDGSMYEIEFEYYDSGKGFVRLMYDSASKAQEVGHTVYTQNEKVWKTAKVVLNDASFGGRLDGSYDFRLTIKEKGNGSTASGESIGIRKVTVTRYPGKNPINVTAFTDEAGDAFEWYRTEKIIHNRFENLTAEEKSVNVRYYFQNEKGRIYFDKTEEITFAPKEVKEVDLNFGELDRSDVYTYNVEITSDDVDSHYELFNLAVLKTDPDGILNERVLWCAHFEWYGSEDIKRDGIELVKLSNSYGIRSSFDWNSMEPTKGVLDWNSSNMHFIVEELYKNGLMLLPSLSGPSLFYHEAWNDMPRTKEQLDGWRRFVEYTIDTLKDYGVKEYEIWNEPNIANFNKYLDDCRGDVYTELVKIAREAANKVDPEAKIGGPSATGINGSWGRDYFDEAIEAEIYKYADAIVVHPYEQKAPEICGMDENIKWFKDKYVNKGISDPDIWNTEVGYSTADDCTQTEEMKGALNCRTALLYHAMDLGERNCFYNFEQKGTIKTDREYMFGSVSPASYDVNKQGKPFVPTVAFAMVTGMNYVMANSEADGIFDSEDKNIRVSRFNSKKFNSKIVTLYAVEGTENVTLDLGVDKVTMYDSLGNSTEIYGKDGKFSFVANANPIYLVGDITKTELAESEIGFGEGSIKAAQNDFVSIDINKPEGAEITAELPETLELKEITPNGSVVMKNYAEIGTTARVTVKITEGEKVIATADIDIETDAAVIPELTIELGGSDVNRWRASVDIKNLSRTNAAKGYIEFTAPELFKSMGKIDIGVIPKNRTGRVEFNLPEIIKKGQYSLQYDIKLNNGNVSSFTDSIDFTVATYASEAPMIDGKLESGEWNMNAAMYADDIGQVKQIKNWGGTEDLSGKAAVMWDEENFYMCAVVTDDVFSQPNSPAKNWAGDGLQIGVMYGDEGFLAIGQGQATFQEIGIALSPEGAAAYRTLSQDSCYPEGLCETARTAITREGNKVYYEFSIPWKDFLRPTDTAPKAGDELGFSFLINDDDGQGRRGWIEYAGGIGEEKNTALFTYLKLIK